MIIVSQDKQRIVNFDNITQIYITFCEEDNPYYWIRFETVDSLYENLGYYETEERAEEVLKEIKEKYLTYAALQTVLGDMRQISGIPKAYEMPEN